MKTVWVLMLGCAPFACQRDGVTDAAARVVTPAPVAVAGVATAAQEQIAVLASANAAAKVVYKKTVEVTRKTLNPRSARAALEHIDAQIEREKDLMR